MPIFRRLEAPSIRCCTSRRPEQPKRSITRFPHSRHARLWRCWSTPTHFIWVAVDQLAALSLQHKLPAIYSLREHAAAGGLISYGSNLIDGYRQIGEFVGRVLKGAKVAEMPVEQPTKFEMVINLKTAKALGLTITPTMLARSDEVIE